MANYRESVLIFCHLMVQLTSDGGVNVLQESHESQGGTWCTPAVYTHHYNFTYNDIRGTIL